MNDDPEKAEDVTSAEDVKPMMPSQTNVDVLSTSDPDRSKEMSAAKLDDFVGLGKYTLVVCIFSELMILQQLSNMLYMVYAGAAPSVVSCGERTFSPLETSKERCAYVEGHASNLSDAQSCTPELGAQFKSVNLEFNFYCSATKLVKQSISAQMLGVMFGSVIFGNLSDTYGRRKIMLISLILCLLCMIGTSFANDLLMFTIWRFFVCVFNGGTMVILMVFMVENLPKKDRFWISNIITWSPNMVVLAIIAYLTEDWRTLTRVSAILAVPAALILLFLCESPRYLVQSRRLADAKAAILRTHRIDGRKCDVELLDHVLSKEEQLFLESKGRKKYSYLHLFYTLTFTRYTIAVAFSMMVTSILNYSLLFNMEKLSGSIYWNSIYMGLFRYSCNLSIAFCDTRFAWLGRKMVHAIANVLSALALATCAIIYIFGLQADLANLARAAVLSVIGVCSLLYTANGIASNELFPTCIRNTSFSFGQVFSRVGVVLSPQVFLLSELWTPLPYLVMFGLAVVDLFLFQFNVTETKGKALVDRMPSKDEKLFAGRRRKKRNDAAAEVTASVTDMRPLAPTSEKNEAIATHNGGETKA